MQNTHHLQLSTHTVELRGYFDTCKRLQRFRLTIL